MNQQFFILQKRILSSIKAEVRKNMGPQSKLIKNYYNSYKREFRGNFKYSSKQELIKKCLESDVILIGDYHTFSQSQKTALRILRDLVVDNTKLVIGLEMLLSEHQKSVNAYLSRLITESEFLEEIDYMQTWGFPWKHFKPIFDFAQTHKIPIIGLNTKSNHLKIRDQHAATIIANNLSNKNRKKFIVLYGDLHLSRSHIPKFLKNKIKSNQLNKSVLTIFQNSESLYWKLAEANLLHKIDVIKLASDRFCIMNAAPWIKLQSYLQWVESGDTSVDESESEDFTQYPEHIHQYFNALAETLKLKTPKYFDFKAISSDQLSLILDMIPNLPLKTLVTNHVIHNKTFYFPEYKTIYLGSVSINAICESASKILYSHTSKNDGLYKNPYNDFYKAILHYCFVYFGTKLLNHKRKCDLEDDFYAIVKNVLNKDSYEEEYIIQKSAEITLKHLKSQRIYLISKKYNAPRTFSGKNKLAQFLLTTNSIGSILGEKMYLGLITNKLNMNEVIKFYKLKIHNEAIASNTYFKLISYLSNIELPKTSKKNWL